MKMTIARSVCLFSGFLSLTVCFAETAEKASQPEMKKSITQYGITWTFEKDVPAGKFITGSWWVIGPVKIVSVSPAPTKGRHGSMVNPIAGSKQSYDDRTPIGREYDFSLNPTFPYEFKPGESLISTRSVDKVGKKTPDTISENYCRTPIVTAAVLTCLDKAPPANAFRPAYCGTWKKIYTTDDLKLDRLVNIEPAGPMPNAKSIAWYERRLERPWLDHRPGWTGRMMHPMENMPDYGREITTITSNLALLLCVKDFAKENPKLLNGYIQLGIDLYGITLTNKSLWNADGGHCSGRKIPILFAGLLLDNPQMLNVKASFQEDQQTYFGKGYKGQKVLWRICNGDSRKHEHLPPEKWAGPPFKGANDGWKSEGYRSLNGPTWIAQALAAQLLGLKEAWGHDAYFDYVDRWVAEGPEGRVSRKTLKPVPYGPFGGNTFNEAMWKTYRSKAAEIGKKNAELIKPELKK